MKILITGASGFIGSHLCDLMSNEDVTPCHLRDWQTMGLPSELDEQYDVVIHAAWGGVDSAGRANFDLQIANVRLFEAVMSRISARPPKLFISFGSQAEIYQTDTIYSRSKNECLRMLVDSAPCRWLWLRLYSLYGEGEGSQWLIPSITRKLLANEPIDLTAGSQEMDYLHVRDAATAVAMAIDSQAMGIYDVGSGRPVKLRDLVEKLHALTGSKSELRFGALPYRADQIMRAKACSHDFIHQTGWQPTVDFDSGLKAVVQHIKRQ
jgi:nucleoside-diphosphate-sugar epimerase